MNTDSHHLPDDDQAEAAVLGWILANPTTAVDVVWRLGKFNCFPQDPHRLIFKTVHNYERMDKVYSG
jgi:replicative DNA helicase